MYNDDYVTVEVNLSFSTRVIVPRSLISEDNSMDTIEDYVVSEIDCEYGGLENLEIDGIDLL